MTDIDLGTNVNAAKQTGLVEAKKPGLTIIMDGKIGQDVTADYNELAYHDGEPTDVKKERLHMWIAKQVGTKLGLVYPNRQWGVIVDSDAGYICIICPSLSTEKGYYLHFQGDTIKNLEKRAVKAGGEILERHGITRNRRFDEDILETLNRNFLDEVVTDSSAPEPI